MDKTSEGDGEKIKKESLVHKVGIIMEFFSWLEFDMKNVRISYDNLFF